MSCSPVKRLKDLGARFSLYSLPFGLWLCLGAQHCPRSVTTVGLGQAHLVPSPLTGNQLVVRYRVCLRYLWYRGSLLMCLHATVRRPFLWFKLPPQIQVGL